MKREPIQDLMRELVWRRKLNETERGKLRGEPEADADLELESRLTEAVAQLPDAAVPSNFTARVLQAIEFEESKVARKRGRSRSWWSWRLLVPRAAVAAVVLIVAGLSVQRHEVNTRRAQLAQSVAQAAMDQPLPSIEALKNFNAIQRMSQPHADEQLLALMQ